MVAQQADQQRQFLFHRGVIEQLRHLVGGALVGLDAHRFRFVHVLVRQLHDPAGERRREQHVQAPGRFRHLAQQEADVLDEAEVKHAVGLVQHHHLHVAEGKDLLLEIIDDASRRADQHVHALFQGAALAVVAGAAEDQYQPVTGMAGQKLGVLVDLHGQFARRRQDHGARGAARTGGHLAGGARGFAARIKARAARQGCLGCGFVLAMHVVEGRQQEGGCLAGAGLRLASHIAPAQCHGQRLRLNRRAVFESGGLGAGQQGFGEPQAGKRGVGKVMFAHYVKAKHTAAGRPRTDDERRRRC